METEKIDIIESEVIAYNTTLSEKKHYKLDYQMFDFMNAFSDTQDLLTVNISNPIKRVMKFYMIKEAIPSSQVELPYSEMSIEQQTIMDNFIAYITNKQ